MLRRAALFLSLPLVALGCSDASAPAKAAPSASEPSAADPSAAEPAEPAPPKPPKIPTPTLTAVYRGAVATRLVRDGVAKADAPPPPAPETLPEAPERPQPRLANAAPAAPGAVVAAANVSPAQSEPSAEPTPPPAETRALVAGPAVPAQPHERAEDEVWTLPEVPSALIWRHPAPAAGLQMELLEVRGRSWPSRVRVEADGDRRVATLVPLEPLPAGSEFRLVTTVVAADGHSQLWTEPLRVKPQD